tara:strand:- start:1219 stop:1383 length:165 start_codon:yes stop_codon:yes gene_type:complete
MNINENLENIYSSHISDLSDFSVKFTNENLQGPLCIRVKEYIDEPLKLMCVNRP